MSDFMLHLPSKYLPPEKGPRLPIQTPPIEFMLTTWAVTHSTLSTWRSARNVRITYSRLPARPSDGRPRLDDLVEYETIPKPGHNAVRKTIAGVDVQADEGGWNWRGRRMLMLISSHWEVLGWGETRDEKGNRELWCVTWFAPTLFTSEGIDIYCSTKSGMREDSYAQILENLKALDAPPIVELVEKHMRPVQIQLPWVTE